MKKAETEDLAVRHGFTVTESHTSQMTMCHCGDVFKASGAYESVRLKFKAWDAEHAHCTKRDPAERRMFWLSFCDSDLPEGQQFLGACLVEVTGAEADEAQLEIMLRFPLAQPGADWIGAAVRKAHELRCNPGGQVLSMPIDRENPYRERFPIGVLLDRATVERIDAEPTPAAGAVDPAEGSDHGLTTRDKSSTSEPS